MVQLRESLFLEKQKTVDTLRDELEQERREISIRAEERINQQLADQAGTLKVYCSCLISYFFCYKTEFFSLPKQSHKSYKMDLDLWDCLGRVKLLL